MPTPCGSPTIAEVNEIAGNLYQQIMTLTIALVDSGVLTPDVILKSSMKATHIMDQMEASMRDEFMRRQWEAFRAFMPGQQPPDADEQG